MKDAHGWYKQYRTEREQRLQTIFASIHKNIPESNECAMIIIRIDPSNNTLTWDEPLSDSLTYRATSFRDAINQAIKALETFGQIMDQEGAKNFDLSKE